MKSKAHLDEIIQVVDNWGTGSLASIKDPVKREAVKQCRIKNKANRYKLIDKYKTEHIVLPNGTKKIVLQCYNAKTEKDGKIIVVQEDIFDAIDDIEQHTEMKIKLFRLIYGYIY